MSQVYNFSAGPAVLDKNVMKQSADAAVEFGGAGLSILEMSHRSKPVVAMVEETTALVKELLEVPDNYEVLFLQGGASLQFHMIPMNLFPEGGVADYADTGSWAAKAIKEGKFFGDVNVVCSSKESTYDHIPKELNQSDNAAYLHICSNNTIFGTRWKEFPTPKNPDAVLVADMSSEIFSRKIDVSKFGIIYAGAQKNMGPAGVTLIIIRKDLIGKGLRKVPTYLDYETHAKAESMFHTPPVFPIYVVNRTLNWLKELGGVSKMEEINEAKAAKLYAEIDRNPLFKGPAAVEDRSIMNVTFVMENKDLEPEFLEFTKARNLSTLNGHRSVGGFRASIYNAMPEAGIDALIDAMQEFEKLKA